MDRKNCEKGGKKKNQFRNIKVDSQKVKYKL